MADASLTDIAKTLRYWILYMTTKAGSGHPTSALSAADLMACLYFKKLRFDLKNPKNPENDRVIFSKGHASPLFYALYKVAGELNEKDMDSYRQFKSNLEGHPRPNFPFAEAATGSLGQGLSIGVGMALAAKLDELSYITYVLMGDSEFAEGSIWEALELASYYKLDNLVGILDVNRLGQSGETMLGWDVEAYRRRVESFGWETHVIDGHDIEGICDLFERINLGTNRPQMIIAKTVKGKGVSFVENKEGWHGKALPQEDFQKAVFVLGDVNKKLTAKIEMPLVKSQIPNSKFQIKNQRQNIQYKIGDEIATRKAYGEAISELGFGNTDIVCLDAETKNSTFAETFKDKIPERFFEMFIAEQNMVGTALGLSRRGKVPFVSTFAVFFTRAYDQIRMSAISSGNIKFVGSHAGVSIGEDGPSQMGLEDFSMFRAVFGSIVLCPGDANACVKLVKAIAEEDGISYLRTARGATGVIYSPSEEFKIGGSKVLRFSKDDKLTVVACGVTLIEALQAADELKKEGINIRVIDAYSIKPIDQNSLRKAASETNNLIITVEDHYADGGLGDAVLNVFSDGGARIHKLAVGKMPGSGKPVELLKFEEINSDAIIAKVKSLV